ncbi:hypothetical protein [Hydrogenovibrio kuenenii]|uniref:hypothetical protein n=1 Tax=Hydrogenovibrio kuenenii TaxID=63658 RepID=UPI0012FEECF7|nr:hypothetical protein [Hydrogenovibrio kuenenii]
MKIQNDELLHSYLFRAHKTHGIFDYSNIVNSKGGWKSFPAVLPETLHLYPSIDEKTVLDKLLRIHATSVPKKMFEYDFGFRKDLEYFFTQKDYSYSSMIRVSKTVSIRFCDACIKEHIRELGYGIIEESWFHYTSCSIHNKPLYILQVNSRSSAVEQLSQALRGELPVSAKSSPNFFQNYFTKEFFEHELIHAPCLFDAFSNFIKYVSKTKHAKRMLGKSYSSNREMGQRYLLEHVYLYLKKSRPRLLNKYWQKYAQTIQVSSGVLDKNAFTVEMVKFSNANCRDCEHMRCVVKYGDS